MMNHSYIKVCPDHVGIKYFHISLTYLFFNYFIFSWINKLELFLYLYKSKLFFYSLTLSTFVKKILYANYEDIVITIHTWLNIAATTGRTWNSTNYTNLERKVNNNDKQKDTPVYFLRKKVKYVLVLRSILISHFIFFKKFVRFLILQKFFIITFGLYFLSTRV